MLTQLDYLQSVINDPDDDAPRLSYAKWLADKKNPIGDLIRIQCELATLDPYSDRAYSLRDSLGALTERHGEEVLHGPVGPVVRPWEGRFGRIAAFTERGFIEHVTAPLSVFVLVMEQLFAITPLRSLHLLMTPRDLHTAGVGTSKAAQRQYYSALQCQELGESDIRSFARIAQSDAMARIRSLDLRTVPLRGDAMRILSRSACLKGLSALHLLGCPCESSDVATLVSSSLLQHLRSFTLSEHMTGESVSQLLGSPLLRQLRNLNVPICRVDSGVADAIATHRSIPGLRHLEIHSPDVSDSFLAAISQSAGWATLADIDISHCNVTSSGIRALCDSSVFGGFTRFDASFNHVESEAVFLIAKARLFSQIADLVVAGCGIDDLGISAISRSALVANLRHFDCSANPITSSGLDSLAVSSALPNLCSLNLSGTLIDDDGLLRFGSSSGMSNIREVQIAHTAVTFEGVAEFLLTPLGRRLRAISCNGNRISNEEAIELSERCNKSLPGLP